MASAPDHARRRGCVAAAPAAAAAALLMLMQAGGMRLASSSADAAALATIMVMGLPHGALDLLELRADGGIADGHWTVVGVYLALGVTMGIAWYVSPIAALAVFLCVAVIHFANDVRSEASSPVRWSRAVLLVALPCATHQAPVSTVFGGMAADADAGSTLAALAGGLASPTLVALGLAASLRPVRSRIAVETATTITALAFLPPLPAFAIFFGLIHSPRHFAATSSKLGLPLRRAVLLAVPATFAALAIGFLLLLCPMVDGVRSLPTAAFMLLSIVTVPHIFTGPLLRRISAGRAGSEVASRAEPTRGS